MKIHYLFIISFLLSAPLLYSVVMAVLTYKAGSGYVPLPDLWIRVLAAIGSAIFLYILYKIGQEKPKGVKA